MWAGGEALYSPRIRSQSFNELMPLNCELHKCFSVFSFPLNWDRMALVGWSWVFPLSHVEDARADWSWKYPQISSSLIIAPVGEALVT